MARYIDPKCRLCRREGMKLFLKGPRCDSVKCPITKRNGRPPGMHQVWRRGRVSEFGLQLREKQKVKRYYGVLERQFMTYYHKAAVRRGNTGEQLLVHLERRLDNAVFMLGYAVSRAQARQLITHGHVRVNGRRVLVPSRLVCKGDQITPAREVSKKMAKESIEFYRRDLPGWLARDDETLGGSVIALPTRSDVSLDIKEQMVVEICSR
ncbi:MAG: 30S ribosomal protein S4 [Planctomycetes bacterium]|nr:30S ribosomal protein S4 [Planctomycetota bacterium]